MFKSLLTLPVIYLFINSSTQNTPPGITKMAGNSSGDTAIVIPLGGNTWPVGVSGEKASVNNEGVSNWGSQQTYFLTWLRINQPGTLRVKVKARADDPCKLSVTIAGVPKQLDIPVKGAGLYDAGEWMIRDTGYIPIRLSGIEKAGPRFADISNYEITGTAINSKTAFVKNNDGNFFYWGRRGPSVHLNYPLPDSVQAQWFYNEITVPAGQDVIGSYFMADGFAEGYFGMQVNSATERRILFSIWSPFSTDDPGKIPADMRIQLLKKGKDVYTGEFGNEGSGGQSYLKFNWKAGATYGFLLSGTPDSSAATTTYTAYFFDPAQNQWLLIASFKRPKTTTSLKRLHSFLENFNPATGDKERSVLFGNQWVYDARGYWTELNQAVFTYDNTAAKGYRMDYAGGLSGKCFFLKNCGFFNRYTPYKSIFTRESGHKPPLIDFNSLP